MGFLFCHLPLGPTEVSVFGRTLTSVSPLISPSARVTKDAVNEGRGFDPLCPLCALGPIEIALCATVSVRACVPVSAHVDDAHCPLLCPTAGNQRTCPGR